MDIVTLGAALNGSAEYVNSHFKGGSNIQIVDNPDGTQTINASGEVSAEDTVARAEIADIKDGETLDSFGDVETALATKANTATTYTKNEIDTALSAKANATDVYSKSDVDTALGGKVDKETGKGLSTNDYTDTEKSKLADIAAGAEVNEIEGIKVNNTTVNPDSNKVVSITIPTSAADVSALPNTTKYAEALSLTINSSTYVMTGQLKDQNGDNLGTAQTIDLPLESVVVGGSYSSQTKKVVLTLQNGNTIEFSVADLVSGLQTELSTSNKLNPAFIEYDSTHRAVSDTEKSTWNSKQNALSSTQLDAVNSGIDSTKVEQIETNKNNISTANAELIELVDNGAKNKLLNRGVMTKDNITYTWTNGDVVVSGTKSAGGNYVEVFPLTELSDLGFSVGDELVISNNGTNCYLSIIFWSQAQSYSSSIDIVSSSKVVTIPTGYTSMLARLGVKSVVTGTVNETIQPMICTKTAWDISHDYQPYAMSNVELTEKVERYTAYHTTAFTTANTWTYTDLSFTIPANQIYYFIASISWSSGQPLEICLSTSATAGGVATSNIIAQSNVQGNIVTCTGQMTADNNSAVTIYCYAKNNSATGSSPTRLTAFRIA